jgi:hypothetical protein
MLINTIIVLISRAAVVNDSCKKTRTKNPGSNTNITIFRTILSHGKSGIGVQSPSRANLNPACALSVTSMTDSIKAGWASSDSSDRINSFVLSPHVSRNVSKIALPEKFDTVAPKMNAQIRSSRTYE